MDLSGKGDKVYLRLWLLVMAVSISWFGSWMMEILEERRCIGIQFVVRKKPTGHELSVQVLATAVPPPTIDNYGNQKVTL